MSPAEDPGEGSRSRPDVRRDLRQLRRRTEPGHLRMMPPEFAALHNHVGSLSHVPHEEHGTTVACYQRFQATLEWIMYDPSPEAENIRRRCFVPKDELGLQTWPTGRSMTTKREDSLSRAFKACYNFTVKADGEETLTTVRTVFEEQELIRCTYTDEALYSRVGKPLSRILDVALAKGGPETAVETLYSAMGGQHKDGGQSNDTLVNRTKVNWSVSSVVAVPELIGRSAERHLETSRPPIMAYSDQRPPMVSRVITRVSRERGRVPILK